MELKLNAFELFELGEKLDKRLHDDGISEKSILELKVSTDELKKIDEDLFYRNNPKDTEYIPSEGEVLVNFKNLTIKIIAIKKEGD